MKKQLTSAAALAFASVLIFSACKKDDDNGNSIVASWEVASLHSSSSTNTTPPTNTTYDTSFAHGKSIVITFKTDNTYTSVDNTETPATTDAGTYLISGSKLVVKDNGSAADTLNYNISGSTLNISQTQTQKIGNFTTTTSFSEVLNRQ